MFQYEPITLYEYITPITCELKKFPVQLVYPSRYTQETILELPQLINITEETVETKNEAFEFTKSTSKSAKNIIHINYTFKTVQESITPTEYQTMCVDMNAIVYDLPVKITFPILD